MKLLADVLVVGAGIPGLVLANKLAVAGFKVVVLKHVPDELVALSTAALPHPARFSSLSLAAYAIFEQLTKTVDVDKTQMTAIKKMLIWDSLSQANVSFCAADNGQDALAYVVENKWLNDSLLTSLKNFPNVSVDNFTALKQVNLAVDAAYLEIVAGQTYTAKLLIGADGAHSWLREQLGMQIYQRDYHQAALIATIAAERAHQQTAYQVFLPTGPLAFLPLVEPHHYSIVWSSTQANDLLTLTSSQFISSLEQNSEKQLGALTLLSRPVAFPLQMRHAKDYVGERIALLGDAAHTIHPLAGQGLNLGIADAVCLADVLIAAQQRQFFSLATLKKYQRIRQATNWNMILAMEGFHQLFTHSNWLLVKTRGVGLKLVNSMSCLKRLLIQSVQ